ncbi:MAG: hypothetical protein MJZ76_06495 [Bacteroidales bacterium]|nr:hypothetical protein [Bacteroidales bacterium]
MAVNEKLEERTMTQKEFKTSIEPLISAAKSIGSLFTDDRVQIDILPDGFTVRVNDFEYQERRTFFCYRNKKFDEEASK